MFSACHAAVIPFNIGHWAKLKTNQILHWVIGFGVLFYFCFCFLDFFYIIAETLNNANSLDYHFFFFFYNFLSHQNKTKDPEMSLGVSGVGICEDYAP